MKRVKQTRHDRGVSAIEYLCIVVLVAVGGIAAQKRLSTSFKCAVSSAVSRFGGGDAIACGEGGNGAPVSTSGDSGGGGTSSCPNGSCMVKGNCFVAGTLVLTESGPQPIETIEPGTQVLSRYPDSGANEWEPVVRTIASVSKALVRLTVAGNDGDAEELRLTPSHALHVDGRGWVPAGELVPGRDLLLGADGERLTVLSAELLPLNEPVYNLEIAELHSYFVGRHGVWAHNANRTPPSAAQVQAWEGELDQLLDMPPGDEPADWREQVAVLAAQLRDAELANTPKKQLTKADQAEKKALDTELGKLDALDKKEKQLADAIAKLQKDKPKNWQADVDKLEKQLEIEQGNRQFLLQNMAAQLDEKAEQILTELHQQDIDKLEKQIADAKAKGDTAKVAALEQQLANEKACPPTGCAKPPALDGDGFDTGFRRKAGKTPLVNDKLYKAFKYARKGTTTGLTIADLSIVGAPVSMIVRPIVNAATGAATAAWDGYRYKTYGDDLKGKLDKLLSQRGEIPPDADHAVARAVTNYAIQQLSQQIDKYHEALRDGIPNTALSMIPFVDPNISNPYKIYKGIKQAQDNANGATVDKGKAKVSKLFDKNPPGDLRDPDVERKTAAHVTLDAAYLNDDKNAQKVMTTLVGDSAANSFGEEWQKVYSVEQSSKPSTKAATSAVNPFIDSMLKDDGFVAKYQAMKPVQVTAQNDPNGVVLHYTEAGLGAGTRPPRYVLEPDPSVTPMSGDDAFPEGYNQTYPLKGYDRDRLIDDIGKANVGPKGTWGKAVNSIKGIANKDTSYPDDDLIKAVADQLSPTPKPRNQIDVPSSSSAGSSSAEASTSQPPPPCE